MNREDSECISLGEEDDIFEDCVQEYKSDSIQSSNNQQIVVVFNIGRSFFNLQFWNNYTDESFNYFYETIEYGRTPENNFCHSNKLLKRELRPLCTNIYNNTCILKLNVFKEKCICDKCLVDTSFFFSPHFSDFHKELESALESDYCRAWGENWIKQGVEQIYTFFCCVKENLCYKWLFESAALYARFLPKPNKRSKSLLENKYGLLEFTFRLQVLVSNGWIIDQYRKSCIKNLNFSYSEGTGKEEKCKIGDVNVTVFNSERDMIEYVYLELMHNKPVVKQQNCLYNFLKTMDENENCQIKDSNDLNSFLLKSNSKTNIQQEKCFVSTDHLKPSVVNTKEISSIKNQDKENCQKIQKCEEATSKNNVFESDLLDEFLEKDSKLNISYEVPTLHAYKQLNPKENKNVLINTEKLPYCLNTSQSLNQEIDVKNNLHIIIKKDRNISNEIHKKRKINCMNEHLYVDQKRFRLLENVKEELQVSKVNTSSKSLSPNFIPIIHKCSLNFNNTLKHNKCFSKIYSLCMILYLGEKRSLNENARKNLEALQSKTNVIDQRMAVIATSAVTTPQKSKVTRIIVPVKSKDLLSIERCWKQRLSYDMLSHNIPMHIPNCDPEINDIVNNVVEYVVLKLDPLEIPHDSYIPSVESPKKTKHVKSKSKVERELSKLINVSIINKHQDSVESSSGECGNEFCVKGCICFSLNNKTQYPLHCGKPDCMFECSCAKEDLGEKIKSHFNDNNLAKEEITWHQTVIRSENGNKIEVMSLVDKLKREKKLPSRYRNSVVGKKCRINFEEDSVKEKCYIEFKHDKQNSLVRDEESSIFSSLVNTENTTNKNNFLERKLLLVSGFFKDKASFGDLFIWCHIHNKYNCLCVAWLGKLKTSELLWKPHSCVRYLGRKMMSRMILEDRYSDEIFIYDLFKHCARTFGAPINYLIRNQTSTFRKKRYCELKNKVLSCTNCFVKMKFFMSKKAEESYYDDCNTEGNKFDKTLVLKGEPNNVYISQETDTDSEIDVGTYELNQTDLGIDVADCELKQTDSDIDVANCEFKEIDSGIDVATFKLKQTDSDINIATCELKQTGSSIDVATCKLKQTDLVIDIADCELKQKDSGIDVATCKLKQSSKTEKHETITLSDDDIIEEYAISDSSDESNEVLKKCSYENKDCPQNINKKIEIYIDDEINHNSDLFKNNLAITENPIEGMEIKKINNISDLLKSDSSCKENTIGDMEVKSDNSLPITLKPNDINDTRKRSYWEMSTNKKGQVIFENDNGLEITLKNRKIDDSDLFFTKINDNCKINSNVTQTLLQKGKRVIPTKKKTSRTSEDDVHVFKHRYYSNKIKIDSMLENNIIYLKSHPNKNKMYGPDKLPYLALLCLTEGIGYLPILEFQADNLAVQDPIFCDFFHSFKNIDAANTWLNIFFKNRIIFETTETSLQWVIVKPGILKLKKSSVFNPSILENPSVMITKDKELKFKKILAKDCPDSILDLCNKEGKRRKIQISEIPEKKRVKKVGDSTTSTSQASQILVTVPLKKNIGKVFPTLQQNNIENKNLVSANLDLKPAVLKPVTMPTANIPVKLQFNNLNGISVKKIVPNSLSPPPLAMRNTVINQVRPFARSKIITKDGKPLILHNNTLIPINIKTSVNCFKPKP